MKPLNFLNIFTSKKTNETKDSGRFSDFFLYAPPEKKIEVFREAAEQANKDQREIFKQSRLGIKTR